MIRIKHNIKTIEILKGKLSKKDLPANIKDYTVVDLTVKDEKPKKGRPKKVVEKD